MSGTINIDGSDIIISDNTSADIALTNFSGYMGVTGQIATEYGGTAGRTVGLVLNVSSGVITGVFDSNMNPQKEYDNIIGATLVGYGSSTLGSILGRATFGFVAGSVAGPIGAVVGAVVGGVVGGLYGDDIYNNGEILVNALYDNLGQDFEYTSSTIYGKVTQNEFILQSLEDNPNFCMDMFPEYLNYRQIVEIKSGGSLAEYIKYNSQTKEADIQLNDPQAVQEQLNVLLNNSEVQTINMDNQTYTIKRGDTLYSIAQSSNVTVDELLQANPWLEEQGRINEDKSYVLIKPNETINISKDNNTYSYDIENSSVSVKDESNNPLALESISNDILINISDGYTTLNTQTKTLDLNTMTTIDGGYGAIVNIKDTTGNDIFVVPDEYVSVYDNNGQLDMIQSSTILNALTFDAIVDYDDTQDNISNIWNNNLISDDFYSTISRDITNSLIANDPDSAFSFAIDTTTTNSNPTTIYDLASHYDVSVSQLEEQNTWLNDTGISYDYTYDYSSDSNLSGSINKDEIVQKVSLIKSENTVRFYQANLEKVA